jgi:hypothetical protein
MPYAISLVLEPGVLLTLGETIEEDESAGGDSHHPKL